MYAYIYIQVKKECFSLSKKYFNMMIYMTLSLGTPFFCQTKIKRQMESDKKWRQNIKTLF